MNKREELENQVTAFLARGGKVSQFAEGTSAIDPALKYCDCGCNGNYTDHSMRAGESGRYFSRSY